MELGVTSELVLKKNVRSDFYGSHMPHLTEKVLHVSETCILMRGTPHVWVHWGPPPCEGEDACFQNMLNFLHLTPLPTTPFSLIFSFLWPAYSLTSLFFLFHFRLNTLFTPSLSTGTSTPPPSPFPPSFFRQDHRKILGNP